MTKLEHKIDFVMDAAPPFASNMIFDAAFKTGADYGSMGTWSVPMEIRLTDLVLRTAILNR